MNLSQNSLRAVMESEQRHFRISVSTTARQLRLQVCDSGPGVAKPAELFEPFRSGTGHGGIGLYVSRAIVRSYGGELKYKVSGSGATFIVEMALVQMKEQAE